ncbi:hypothetical protein [Psychromicrobium sp. YIM B11713]|uniref:hypothetical protein n=1 Tax=Psychromicrobium sp. YIM B11713 TaxID=3145233 RepID=UPI00374EFA21
MSQAVNTPDQEAWATAPQAAGTPVTGSLAGYTRISRTALNRVLAAIAADAFSLKASQVKAQATDDGGKLAIEVSVPVKVPSLIDIAQDANLLSRSGGDLVAQASAARRVLGARATELTGSTVGRIDIDLSNTITEGKAALQ